MFVSPGPIIAEFGPITLRWYGLLTATAFIVALNIGKNLLQTRQENLDDQELKKLTYEDLSNFAITALITGLIGARAWFVILSYEYFSNHPLEIPQIWLGGQSIQGAILGAAIGTFVCFCYKALITQNKVLLSTRQKGWLFLTSIIASVMPLGQAIGRWGNFFNEEAFGRVTELPWKLYISHTGQYHHPTFLYEAIWNLGCFAFLFYFSKKNPAAHSKIIGLYIGLYSLGRFIIEPMRTDSLMIGAFPAASVIALLGILVGILIYKRLER